MILSIRHRILLPFLLITFFMTFSAMLICTELINGYFDNQLKTSALNILNPIENSFHQIATKTYLEFSSPNKVIHFDKIVEQSNKQTNGP